MHFKRRGRLSPAGVLATAAASLLLAVLALPTAASADPIPLGEIGSFGTGAGQLNNPSGPAIDVSGNLYVADSSNERISVFGPDGTFTHAFGWGVDTGAAAFEVCTAATTCQTGISGGGGGQLDFPYGVALDGAGGLYISDIDNQRISVFDVSGMSPTFTHAFGWDVDPAGGAGFEFCTTGTGCKPGAGGGGAGQLDVPAGVDLDGAGGLHVADQDNQRISVFDVSGVSPAFTHAFGWGVQTGASMFEVCIDDATGCQQGLDGGGAGQLNFPTGVAVGGAGGAWVADIDNNRISVFDVSGMPAFTHAFGWGVDTGAGAFEVCTEASTCQRGGFTGAGALVFPISVAHDGAGGLYAVELNRISVFDVSGVSPTFTHAFGWGVDTGAAAFEVCTTGSGCLIGSPGNGAGQLGTPRGVAVDGGAAFVAEYGDDRVQCFGEGPPPDLCGPYPAPPAAPPPAPPAPPAQIASAPPPSNDFAFGKQKRNKKKGIAFLFVNVPGPGEVGLAGKGVRNVGISSATAQKSVFTAGGVVKLKIKPGKGKEARKIVRQLKDKGKAKMKVRVTYVPTGGTANTQARKVKLLRR